MRLLFFLTTVTLLFGWEPDRDFINAASLANVTEISATKVALARSQTSFVKDFAQKMIEDHSKVRQELTTLARQENMILASTPDTDPSSNTTLQC